MGAPDTASVDRFLYACGIGTRVAFFGESDFVVGSEALLDEIELVFRVEAGELVVCHFAARTQTHGLDSAVGRLVSLLERILAGVPGLTAVRGMILPSLSDPELDRAHRRLAEVLESRGARWVEVDGAPWLRFSREGPAR